MRYEELFGYCVSRLVLYISPAAFIAPGERTGTYRTGKHQLLTNDKSKSRISAEYYAVAPSMRSKRLASSASALLSPINR